MNSLYLASGSPRRRELLTQIGVPFTVVSAAIDETPLTNESPVSYVERLARAKAAAGFAALGGLRSHGLFIDGAKLHIELLIDQVADAPAGLGRRDRVPLQPAPVGKSKKVDGRRYAGVEV